ncbi:MAG TPA: NUDIX domain-containing protein [Candidatus Dormibacteraeota bacterium]|nr:NUDIX domain-containing protein [Candidatus Dormibacteraeota bacterium]
MKTPKADVHYRDATDLARSCRTCWKYRGSPRSSGYCLLIAGDISPDDTCDNWAAKRVRKGDPPTSALDQLPNHRLKWDKVRIFVFNAKGELLALRRGPHRHRVGQWEMVQGSIEPTDASPEQAALREFREETGYTLADLEDWTQISERTYAASLVPGAGVPDITKNPEDPPEHDAVRFGKPEIVLSWFGRTALKGDDGMAKAAPVDDVERILRAVAWDDFDALTRLIAPGLGEAASEGVVQGFQDLGVADDEAFALASADAIDYARTRAADLIDDIVPTTRNGIRALIETALVDGWSGDQLAQAIQDSVGFSADRAARIASFELAAANTQGNMVAWRRSGVVKGKQWLLGNDHDEDDICDQNADAGVIPLDALFPSGDDGPPAHPACACVCVPVLHEDDGDA